MKLKNIQAIVFIFPLLSGNLIFGQKNDEFSKNIECYKKIISLGFTNHSWDIDSIYHLKSCDKFFQNKNFKVENDTLKITSKNDSISWQEIVLKSDTSALIILNVPRQLTGKSKKRFKKKNRSKNHDSPDLIYLKYSKDGKLNFNNNAL